MKKQAQFTPVKEKTLAFQYFLTAPSGFDPVKESLPLIVFLHGAGERGYDIEQVKIHGIPKLFANDENYHRLRVITLSPQCPPDKVWNHLAFELMELIEYIASEYNADRRRISLTGLSMGGFGTWEMGLTFPGFFAALAPICGGGQAWRASVLHSVPIRAFHGDLDSVVPVARTQEMIKAVENAGGTPSFTVFKNTDHDSWTQTYESTDLIEWLAVQKTPLQTTAL